MFLLALLPLLLKLVLLLGERVFQQFRQSVCSVAASLCLGVCLLFTRLPTNFSTAHSVAIVCAGDIRLLFKLPIKFGNIPRDEGPLLVIKISKKTSEQRSRFSFALKRNKTKHNQILHENIHATRE